jgi:hypothetical protein
LINRADQKNQRLALGGTLVPRFLLPGLRNGLSAGWRSRLRSSGRGCGGWLLATWGRRRWLLATWGCGWRLCAAWSAGWRSGILSRRDLLLFFLIYADRDDIENDAPVGIVQNRPILSNDQMIAVFGLIIEFAGLA